RLDRSAELARLARLTPPVDKGTDAVDRDDVLEADPVDEHEMLAMLRGKAEDDIRRIEIGNDHRRGDKLLEKPIELRPDRSVELAAADQVRDRRGEVTVASKHGLDHETHAHVGLDDTDD